MKKDRSRSIISFSILTVLAVLAVFRILPSSAQSPAPSDLKFICGIASNATKSAPCVLQVPADLIGASFDIQITKGKATGLQNLKKGDSVPSSALFFHLDSTDQTSVIHLDIDYADMKAVAFGTTPYALFKFDVGLSFAGPNDFPMTIPAPMKLGGQLYTPASLALNQSSFLAMVDVPLELRIGGLDTTSSVAPPVTSSFKFAAPSSTTGTIRPPSFYCFDDPIDSMTDPEWEIVCDAKRRGIVSGNPRDNGVFFFPNQPINRAEAVKIVTLGILRSLGKLSDTDFTREETRIKSDFPEKRFITYPDIEYETNGAPPWFAVYVNIAGQYKIAEGYPHDGTFKAVNKINNAESYRVIVETGRVASTAIAKALETATKRSSLKTEDWYLKYSATLEFYKLKYSEEYAQYTTRKEFLIIVMNLLKAVGL